MKTMDNKTIFKEQMSAYNYAILCHESTNHTYDGHPYNKHLGMAYDWGDAFSILIPKADRVNVFSAILCHDVIEDTRETRNDVAKNTNEIVAELVYAVTNEKGRTRKERANNKYYRGIRNTKYATFVKLCDRLANVEYSAAKANIESQSGMFFKYKAENLDFKYQLLKPKWYNLPDQFLRLILPKSMFVNYRQKKSHYLDMFIQLDSILNSI